MIARGALDVGQIVNVLERSMVRYAGYAIARRIGVPAILVLALVGAAAKRYWPARRARRRRS